MVKCGQFSLSEFCTSRASEARLIVDGHDMRIISGRYRGLQLTVPSDAKLRPSSDRLRSGVFSALDSLGILEGAEVLDLFAGTGAYGFEALSRGANHSVMIEKDGDMVAAMRDTSNRFSQNRSSEEVEEIRNEATIIQGALPVSLGRAAEAAQQRGIPAYSLVFADPPYAADTQWLPNLLVETLLVHIDSVLVFESAKQTPAFAEREFAEHGGLKFELFKERPYGDSIVRFYRWR